MRLISTYVLSNCMHTYNVVGIKINLLTYLQCASCNDYGLHCTVLINDYAPGVNYMIIMSGPSLLTSMIRGSPHVC